MTTPSVRLMGCISQAEECIVINQLTNLTRSGESGGSRGSGDWSAIMVEISSGAPSPRRLHRCLPEGWPRRSSLSCALQRLLVDTLDILTIIGMNK
jgi:hypothetical protein